MTTVETDGSSKLAKERQPLLKAKKTSDRQPEKAHHERGRQSFVTHHGTEEAFSKERKGSTLGDAQQHTHLKDGLSVSAMRASALPSERARRRTWYGSTMLVRPLGPPRANNRSYSHTARVGNSYLFTSSPQEWLSRPGNPRVRRPAAVRLLFTHIQTCHLQMSNMGRRYRSRLCRSLHMSNEITRS